MENKTVNAELLAKMFMQGTIELNNNKHIVDALNVFPVPDGDTGTNMSLTMNASVEGLSKGAFVTVEEVAKVLSKGSLMGARGNSGVILSQIFRGFAKGCKDKNALTAQDLCHAFKEAADTAYSAVLKPVEGTILTVIRKIAERAEAISEEVETAEALFEALLEEGERTLEKTPEQLPVLKQAGVVDAGGKGLLFFLQGCQKALLGVEVEMDALVSKTQSAPAQSVMSTEDIHFAYCTEFILQNVDTEAEGLKTYIETLGDSMVFVQDEDLVKVHVHTNSPGLALEEGLKYGALKTVKIENMKDQHSSIIEGCDETAPVAQDTYEEDYGFIGVAMGEGFVKIFSELGIAGTIKGGQTMNPSTEDFLKEIEKCPSKHIFLFPNNSNIIMAANQAKALSDKDVYVIPTKTMPQCISAMLAFDREAEPALNFDAMVKSLDAVDTIQITYAVRDTVFNDKPIQKDDYLAVSGGEIKGVGAERDAVILKSIEETMSEDAEILSLYYGSDVTAEEADAVVARIEEKFPDLEVDVYYGGQPVYYFVISIE